MEIVGEREEGGQRTRKLGNRRFCVISSASLSRSTSPNIDAPSHADLYPTALANTIAEMCHTVLPDDLDGWSFRPPLGFAGGSIFGDMVRKTSRLHSGRGKGDGGFPVVGWLQGRFR